MTMSFTRRVLAVFLLGGIYLLAAVHYMSEHTECPDYREELLRAEVLEEELRRLENDKDIRILNKAPEVKAPLNVFGPAGDSVVPLKAPRKGSLNLPGQDSSEIKTASPGGSPEVVYSVDLLSPSDLLHPHMIPNTIFYIWCGRRWFEYHHYISVLSVIKELNPDNIVFYYDTYPIMDYWLYNTWFDEIRAAHPFVRTEKLHPDSNACADFGKANLTFIQNTLNTRGGIYFHEATMLDHFPLKYKNRTFVNALDPETGMGFVMSRPFRYQPTSIIHHTCGSIETYNKGREKPICLNFDDVFYPKDIWDADTPFAALARTVFYGTPVIPKPLKSYDNLIPNIAHIAWIGGGEMDYLFYLCVLSLIYVAEVDMVYIHGNAPPTGRYWDRVKHNERLRVIYRETPGEIYGTKVEIISHVTDIWRCDWMMKYGGIYVDTDTIFVRPLDREIRSYDAVGAYDWTDWNPPFPDTINFGVLIGKRKAPFFKKFQESMKWWIDSDWSWNGLRQPYRIKERNPELILINPHLQVICYNFLCRPTWYPGYHNESQHHLNTPSITDWKKQAYSYHFTLPTPPELLNESNLLAANSMIAEIGKQVLDKAGLLPKNFINNPAL